jgi:hypothetical protein
VATPRKLACRALAGVGYLMLHPSNALQLQGMGDRGR